MPIRIIKRAARFAFADGGSIKARVLRSGIWVGAAEVGTQALNIIRSIALARLLTPEVFGLMGLAMIVVRMIETFTRPGIAQALIARQKEFEEASATAFTLLVTRGVLLSLVLAAVAPWAAQFYDADELEPVLQTLSLVFIISGLSNINLIARQRELDFRRLTYLSQVTTLVGTIVTVAMAWWFRSVWALVVGQIVQAGMTAWLSYYFVGGRLRFAFDAGIARELMTYGKFIAGSSIVLYIAVELDSAVIGKLLGTEQLGFYTLAATISMLATLNLSKIASGIMMPAYSKLQSDMPALRNAYLRALSLVMFLVLPASAGVIVLAEPLLYVVYGEKWLGATVPLQVLAFFGVSRALLSFDGYLFEGIGKPKIAFRLGLFRLTAVVLLIVPMVTAYGLLGAAITVTIGGTVQWLTGLVFLRRHMTVGFADVALSAWRPLWTSLVMSLIVYLLTIAVDVRTPIGLSMGVLGGMAVYGVLNWSFLLKLTRERLG